MVPFWFCSDLSFIYFLKVKLVRLTGILVMGCEIEKHTKLILKHLV